jgi:hypothetical protein
MKSYPGLLRTDHLPTCRHSVDDYYIALPIVPMYLKQVIENRPVFQQRTILA